MNYPQPKILSVSTPEYISIPEYKDPVFSSDATKNLAVAMAVAVGVGLAILMINRMKYRDLLKK